MEKRNPLQVDRFHRVNKLMREREMSNPNQRKQFIGQVLEQEKMLSECSAHELGLILIALGEAPQEGEQIA